MASSIEMCAICAWRATCSKKFNVSGRDMHCPDYAEDMEIKKKREAEKESNQNQGNA